MTEKLKGFPATTNLRGFEHCDVLLVDTNNNIWGMKSDDNSLQTAKITVEHNEPQSSYNFKIDYMQTPVTNIWIYFTQNFEYYKSILNQMHETLGDAFLHSMLCWCKIINDKEVIPMWKVGIVKEDIKQIGVTGIYELPTLPKVCWLGWFGLYETEQKQGKGSKALKATESWAKWQENKYSYMMLYCDIEVAEFYRRNGYEIVCTVKKYLELNPKLSPLNFEIKNQVVMSKKL